MSTAKNPAQLLYDRLNEWKIQPGRTSPSTHRSDDSGDWLGPHVEVIGWLQDVRGEFVDDDDFIAAFNDICEGVFCCRMGISGYAQDNTRMINDTSMAVLKMLAKKWRTPSIDIAQLPEIATDIESLRGFLETSTHLDDEARRYLFELTKALDHAITEFRVFGTGGVNRLANELIGALAFHFADAPEDERNEATSFVSKIANGSKKLFHVSVGAAVEAGATAVLQMLPPGP